MANLWVIRFNQWTSLNTVHSIVDILWIFDDTDSALKIRASLETENCYPLPCVGVFPGYIAWKRGYNIPGIYAIENLSAN